MQSKSWSWRNRDQPRSMQKVPMSRPMVRRMFAPADSSGGGGPPQAGHALRDHRQDFNSASARARYGRRAGHPESLAAARPGRDRRSPRAALPGGVRAGRPARRSGRACARSRPDCPRQCVPRVRHMGCSPTDPRGRARGQLLSHGIEIALPADPLQLVPRLVLVPEPAKMHAGPSPRLPSWPSCRSRAWRRRSAQRRCRTSSAGPPRCVEVFGPIHIAPGRRQPRRPNRHATPPRRQGCPPWDPTATAAQARRRLPAPKAGCSPSATRWRRPPRRSPGPANRPARWRPPP